MKCPRDGEVLAHLAKKGVEFHGCHLCKGLLVEPASLALLFKKSEQQPRDYFKSLVPSAEFLNSADAVTCPKCKYNMYETENRGIVLDFCMNCQSVWFDHGELQSIVKRLKAGETFNLVPLPDAGHASGLILQLLRDEWL